MRQLFFLLVSLGLCACDLDPLAVTDQAAIRPTPDSGTSATVTNAPDAGPYRVVGGYCQSDGAPD